MSGNCQKNMKSEVWKEITDLKGYYISNYGNVKSDDTIVKSHKGGTIYERVQYGKILKGGETTNGYQFVHIKGKNYFRHILVAEAFLEKPNYKCEVNHKDENPKNNKVENLEYITHKENCNYGRRKNGNQDKSKKVAQYTLDGELVKIYDSLRKAEKENNVPRGSSIAHCCRGKQKQFNNFIWKYYEEV